jgi:deoxyribonuclease V
MTTLSHSWDLSAQEAIALQNELAGQVIREPLQTSISTVAGIDMSFRGDSARAAVVVLSYPQLTILDYATAEVTIDFPYIPGLLSFREGPPVLAALDKVKIRPELLIFDGQGLAHPRRFGIACHIGLLVDLPAVGCAKSRLVGRYEAPHPERGSYSLLVDRGETVGAVVRTRDGVKPVFVSIGHRIDLPTSIDYILNTGAGYRLPEPTRWAHLIAGGAEPPRQNDATSPTGEQLTFDL